MQKFKNTILTYLKGIAMGGADVVPGVSGGTVAFITGIYETLLNSIKGIDVEAIRLLFSFKLKSFWNKINGNFLLTLFLGILTSLLTLARLLNYLLTEHPIPIWSFFFGLIIISAVLVLREIKKWNISLGLSVLAGIAIAYFITEATPTDTPDGLWFIFISGTVAICAMILPGISGSFILLIMGKYEHMISAINSVDILTIIVFALGCLVGLLTFVRVVSWLFNHYHDITVALLSGFMIGALNKIWPWKIAINYRVNSQGVQVPYVTENVLPAEYLRELGKDPQLFQALLFMALGIFIVVFIEKLAHYRSKSVK